jgi:crossover junction endodeoxyribonuclease RuvC
VIRPPNSASLPQRLWEIQEGLAEVIERTDPGCVVVEGVFYGQNVRSMVVLAHARGVAVLTAAQRDLPVFEYPPAEIKKAVVGTGGATKEQVSYMVAKHLRLATPPEPSDASDGCAAALCHLMGGRTRQGEATPAGSSAAGSTPAGGP